MLPRSLTAGGVGHSAAASATPLPLLPPPAPAARRHQQQQQQRRPQAATQAASGPAAAGLAAPLPRGAGSSSSSSGIGAAASPSAARRSNNNNNNKSSLRCRATIDDVEIQVLVRRLEAATPPPPPPSERPKLQRCLEIIDAANGADPKKAPGGNEPYRLAYGRAVYVEALRLDPRASDALLILARGRQVESWRLPQLFKRDDYAPNAAGARQHEGDRRRWLSRRLLRCMREAGYRGPLTPTESAASSAARAAGEPDPLADLMATLEPLPEGASPDEVESAADEAGALKLVDDVMMSKAPDPRDLRPYDFSAPLGAVNWPLLRGATAVQTLADADALVFLDKNFVRMLDESGMTADEVAAAARRELGRMSARAVAAALRRPWAKKSDAAKRALYKCLPVPFKYSDIMLDAEGTAAASVHPGDWRYRDFDYE